MAFIGGVGHLLRADHRRGAGHVPADRRCPTYTEAWLLYFGLFFVVMVMFAPGGIAGLIVDARAGCCALGCWRA